MDKKVLVIDNYDSFTYNLVHLLEELDVECEVWRNDQYDLKDIDRYNTILLSPGPGLPSESGLLLETIKRYAPTKKILGICLGMQAIAEVYGATLINLEKPFHGVASNISIEDRKDPLFHNFPSDSKIGRYHSWAVDKTGFPKDQLTITAYDENGIIMALSHNHLNVKGIQFHPESVLSDNGIILIQNWLNS